jgi:hypothetical protein
MSRLFRSHIKGITFVLASLLLAVSSTLITLVSLGSSAGAAVPQQVPKNLSHFLCYQATPTNGYQIPSKVILENQFNPSGFVPKIGKSPLIHCNPVMKTVVSASGTKTVYKIINPDAHLLCYPITASTTQATYTVQVTNQFGEGMLETGQPNELCLPTWKSLTGPPNESNPEPPKLSHFTCYPVNYVPGTAPFQVPPAVLLKDEFSAKNVRVSVGDPEELCVPTTKIVKGVRYPAINPKAHLLCFEVSQTPIITPVFDQNQFGTDRINIGQTNYLCLPSLKTIVK